MFNLCACANIIKLSNHFDDAQAFST